MLIPYEIVGETIAAAQIAVQSARIDANGRVQVPNLSLAGEPFTSVEFSNRHDAIAALAMAEQLVKMMIRQFVGEDDPALPMLQESCIRING